ncbi:MAG: hypothetical protein EOP84_29625 [Verrucomicrobiaceae bacterium]|nr:MAG: hypothetical protein EOP84_29625 [Verrucomicrobiaceae bacterium]
MKREQTQPSSLGLADPGRLASTSDGAVVKSCSERSSMSTDNSYRFPAYPDEYGSPVLVLPEDVSEFLQTRPDIACDEHTKEVVTVPEALFSLSAGTVGTVVSQGRSAIHVVIDSLGCRSAAEIALVARCFSEVARQLGDAISKSGGKAQLLQQEPESRSTPS